MKILIALIAAGFSTLTIACTNFSGTFENQDTKDIQKIIQNDCDLIKFQETDKTTSVIVDGTYHQTLNEDIIVNGVKHGVIQVFQSARFGTTELFLDSKLHTEVDEAIEDAETNAILTLNSDGDLVTVQSSEDGQIETIISKRLNKE
jgi:hypothetical protein